MSKIRFVDPGIIVTSGGENGGDSSISSSYALSASHADFATSASYAEYAVSASHEITKEVSSSYADTASLALSGNGPFTGSFTGSFFGNGTGLFSGSFSGSIPDAYQIISGSVSASISPDNGLQINSPVDITMPSGSVFTIHEPDIDQQNRLDFRFDQGNPMLEIASRSTTSSLYLRTNQTQNGLLFDSSGKIKYIVSGTTYAVKLTTAGFVPNAPAQLNLGDYNRRWKDLYVNNGNKISFGVSDNSDIDLVSFRHTVGTNTLVMSGSSDVSLDVKGSIEVTNITASNNISSSNNIFAKQLYIENNLAIDYDFSHNCISFGNVSDCLNLLGTSITASSNLSSSATSTASFGTYLGDGSQLTGIETDPFPYTGSAIISGSTELIGPVNITGSTIIFSSGTPGLTIQSNSDPAEETKIYDAKIALEDSGLEQVVIKSNTSTNTMTGNISLRAATLAYGFLAAHNWHSNNRISWLSSGIRLGERLSDPDSSPNQTSPYVLSATGSIGFEGNTDITGSLTITGSQTDVSTAVEKVDLGRYHIKTKNSHDLGFLGSFGAELIISSSDFAYKTPMVVLYRNSGFMGDDRGTDLWAKNNLFVGGASYVNGEISTIFTVSGSSATGGSGTILLGNPDVNLANNPSINLYGHLTASTGVNISASATSTASFGTYLGDGSQLTGIETDPFPYTGDAVISGSLTVQSGSTNSITGITLINPSNPGTTQDTGAGITMFNYTGATGSIHIKDYTAGGLNPYHPAMIFNSSDAFYFKAADDARDGTWFTAQKVYQNFHMDQINNNAAEWIMGINNGGSSYSRLVIGQGSTTANGWFFQNNGYDEDLKIGETTGAGGTGTYTNRILISSSRMQIGDSSNDLKLSVSGSITSNNTASAAYFVGDGSQLTNLPTSDPFPYSGSAIISSSGATASLTLEGSGSTVFDIIGSQGTLFSVDDDLSGTIFTANDISGLPILEASASGDVYIGKSPQSLYTTAVISSTTAATTQSIFGLSTSSYDGAFFDYTVQSGSNARAGSIMSIWSGSTINYTETTTTDIGNTTDFNLIVHISQSQAQIASHATNAGYKIKTIIRSI